MPIATPRTGTATRRPTEAVQHPSNSEPSSSQDLTHFGYSNLYDHNVLGIVKKLEQFEIGSNLDSRSSRPSEHILPDGNRDEYKAILRKFPCPSCTRALVAVYFSEFNWKYSLLDAACFHDELCHFFTLSSDYILEHRDDLDPERLVFPVLLF